MDGAWASEDGGLRGRRKTKRFDCMGLSGTTVHHDGMTDGSANLTGVDVRILGHIPQSREDDARGQAAKTSTGESQREKRPSRRRYNRDEFATVYASSGDMALLSKSCIENGGEVAAAFGEGSLCRLVHFVYDESSTLLHTRSDEQARLWAPVILRQLPELAEKNDSTLSDGEEDANANASCDRSVERQQQRRAQLFVPPNVAATIGIQQLHIPLDLRAHLQLLPKRDLSKATRATLVEIGRSPPEARFRWPIERPASDVDDKSSSGVELREYFLSSKNSGGGASQESKPKQRLLALGSIISTPVYKSRFDPLKFETYRYIDSVVLYQVTEIKGSISAAQQSRGDSDLSNERQHLAYVVSPSTHLVLEEEGSGSRSPIHPQLDHTRVANHTWRLPCMSKCLSCLESVANSDEVRVGPLQTWKKEVRTERSYSHPSAGKLADAIYLHGAIPAQSWLSSGEEVDLAVQNHLPLIDVTGTEENFVMACVDEAADLSEYLQLL